MTASFTRIAVVSNASDTPRFATVRYSGLVPPTIGEWLGVEWDDGKGKHSGVYDKTGVQYFSCRTPGAGSFIRPNTPGLTYGISFAQAVHTKYLDTTAQDEAGSTFHTTNSNFEVEVVSLTKIRSQFRQLERLREIGLENEGVNGPGEPKEIVKTASELPKLTVLNLSYSLLSNFESVSGVITHLSSLKTLILNSNRFAPLHPSLNLPGFEHITTLLLNSTLTTWADIITLAPSLPLLEDLQLGSNDLHRIDPPTSPSLLPNLKTLNLEENSLNDWQHVCDSLSPLLKLERLILSHNLFPSISSTAPTSLRTLKYLAISDNLLSSWNDVDQLSALASLEGIWSSGNPFAKDLDEERQRAFTIGRLKALKQLEGSNISPAEREDAEIFYLSEAQKEKGYYLSEEGLNQQHPRLPELASQYGRAAPELPKPGNIRSKLIQIQLSIPSLALEHTLSVLPTQPTRLLRSQAARIAGVSLPKAKWQLVAELHPESHDEGVVPLNGSDALRVEIPAAEESRQIDWWGLQSGDAVQILAS